MVRFALDALTDGVPPDTPAVLAHTALKRWGAPEDLVGAYQFLASDASAFVTGTVLTFEFGLLWPRFMDRFGAAFGIASVFLRTWLRETPIFEAIRRRSALSHEIPVKAVLRDKTLTAPWDGQVAPLGGADGAKRICEHPGAAAHPETLDSPNAALGLSTGLFRGFMVAGGIGTVLPASSVISIVENSLSKMLFRHRGHAATA